MHSELVELNERRASAQAVRGVVQVCVSHRHELVAKGVSDALDRQSGFSASIVQPCDLDHADGGDLFVADEHLAALMARAEGGRFGAGSSRVVVIADSCREMQVRQALASGVSGYLHIGCAAAELLTCLRRVVSGDRYLCLAAAQSVALSAENTNLTRREADVLCFLGEGQSNRAIASELGISIGTVKTHVRGIMSKLSARNRTEVVSVAARRGIPCAGRRRAEKPRPGRFSA